MMWKYYGQERPDFAEIPGPGSESVWDYPRPPRIEKDKRTILVRSNHEVLAETTRAYRILETASPPTFYIPPSDIKWEKLLSIPGTSHCEWKGTALYWALKDEDQRTPVGWSYPEPAEAFSDICEYTCFYPGRLLCFVDGERVRGSPSLSKTSNVGPGVL